MSETDGVIFGRYVAVRLLGKGAMGRVYLANDPVLQRPIAVKVIAIEEDLDEQTRNSFLERFSLEARASAKLRHPSIVTVYDAGEQSGFPWIAFEYIEGESLEDLLNREKRLSNVQTKTILTDIASALQHAHEAGIIHRDVKPANILIDKQTGISKLSDFGVIKAPFSMKTQEGMTLGSPGYMSPEQIDGSGVDPRSDLFSLGIIYYQMLTGVHPFLRDSLQSTLYATLMGEYSPIRQIRADIDNETAQVVEKLLKVKKEDRFKSASEFLSALERSNSSKNFNNSNSRLLKIVEPIVDVIRKTDDVVFNSVKSSDIRSFLNQGTKVLHRKLFNFREKLNGSSFQNILKSKQSRLYTITFFAGFLALFFCWFTYSTFFSLSTEERTVLKELASEGYKGSPSTLVKKCLILIDKNELNDAENIADGLEKIKSQSAHAFILDAIIQLKDRDEDDVLEAINNAKRIRGFKSAFECEKKLFISELKNFLTDDEISREMIDCICYTLHINKDRNIKKWPYERQYWLRWNSIRILNETGEKIDMVEVYILDLKHAGSLRVRLKATNKLGEMKDKRAQAALEEIAQRGFADPIVSVAAQSALDNHSK